MDGAEAAVESGLRSLDVVTDAADESPPAGGAEAVGFEQPIEALSSNPPMIAAKCSGRFALCGWCDTKLLLLLTRADRNNRLPG